MSKSQPRHNSDRLRRAKSWHKHSVEAEYDDDKFLFLWIAFNAAYGLALLDPNGRAGSARKEWDKLQGFLKNLIEEDTKWMIRNLLWGRKLSDRQGDGLLYGPVPRLLRNQYVYCYFWYYVHNRREHRFAAERGGWLKALREANDISMDHLCKSETFVASEEVLYVLEQVFSRLYTLRNQMVHGGTTCGPEGKGREQIADGTTVMEALVPAILEILQTHIDESDSNSGLWGPVAYPHVDEEGRLIDESEAAANSLANIIHP